MKPGAKILLGSLVFAFSPMFIAIIAAFFTRGPAFSEAEGAGAVMWLMILTLPVGFIGVIIGGIMMVVGAVKSGGGPVNDVAPEFPKYGE